MLQFRFPGTSPAQAGILAQRLRMALLREGVPDSKVGIEREDPDAMDTGTIVQLIAGLYDAAHTVMPHVTFALEVGVLAKVLYEACTPAGSKLQLITPEEKFEVDLSQQDTEELRKILVRIAEDEGKR